MTRVQQRAILLCKCCAGDAGGEVLAVAEGDLVYRFNYFEVRNSKIENYSLTHKEKHIKRASGHQNFTNSYINKTKKSLSHLPPLGIRTVLVAPAGVFEHGLVGDRLGRVGEAVPAQLPFEAGGFIEHVIS